MALPVALKHAGGIFRLYTVDFDRRLQLLDGKGHAGDKPTAAHRDR